MCSSNYFNTIEILDYDNKFPLKKDKSKCYDIDRLIKFLYYYSDNYSEVWKH